MHSVVGSAVLTKVYDNVQYSAPYAADELNMGIGWALKVQATEHTFPGNRIVDFVKGLDKSIFLESSSVKPLDKPSAIIRQHLRLYFKATSNMGSDKFEQSSLIIFPKNRLYGPALQVLFDSFSERLLVHNK